LALLTMKLAVGRQLILRAPLTQLDNPETYLVDGGMAEEWWSTISQRSPFLT
jgi:hypothetical protein